MSDDNVLYVLTDGDGKMLKDEVYHTDDAAIDARVTVMETHPHGGVPIDIDTITGWPHIPRQGEYVWASEGKYRVDEVIHSPQTNGITLKVTEVDPETHEPT